LEQLNQTSFNTLYDKVKKVEQELSSAKDLLAKIKGNPVIQGYAGKKFDLNDNLNVIDLLKKIRAAEDSIVNVVSEVNIILATPETTDPVLTAHIANKVEPHRPAPDRITSADSPFTLTGTERDLFVNTDAGNVIVNLITTYPAIYSIKNSGSSGNTVTINPAGAELLFGVNAPLVIYDGEVIDLQYETTEGWQ
jgi:hypothetical protein